MNQEGQPFSGDLLIRPSRWSGLAWHSFTRESALALLLVPGVLLVVVAFLWPAANLLSRSVTEPPGGLSHYADLFASISLLKILARSAWTAAVITALSLLFAYPFAYLAATSSPRIQRLLLVTIAGSLFISVVVRGYAWLTILDRHGAMNAALVALGLGNFQATLVHNFAGVLIGLVQYGIPFMVLPIYDVMRRFDERLSYAAATLGARPSIAFLHVYLPLTMPGVVAGCTIVFISSLGYYILPSILGGPANVMIGQLIASKIQTTLEWGLGAAIASLLLVVAMVFFFAFYRLTLRVRTQAHHA
jgi:ABC-type spermidine/putrescine transport system permease subunit I